MKIETTKTREIDGLTFGLKNKIEEVKRALKQIQAKQNLGGAAEKEFFHGLRVEVLELNALIESIEYKALDAATVSKAFSGQEDK